MSQPQPPLPDLRGRLPLSAAVSAAFDGALARLPPGGVLQTGPLMAALIRADLHGDWLRIRPAHIDKPGEILEQALDDSRIAPPAAWGGVPVSGELRNALVRVEMLASRYRRSGEVEPGLLALALVCEDGSGAWQALRLSTGRTRRKLIEIIQADVLGATLPGVGRLLSAALPPLPAAPAPVPMPFAPTAATGADRDETTVVLPPPLTPPPSVPPRPGPPQPVPPDNTATPLRPVNRDPLAVALGNASLLGVGYLMLGKRGIAALTGLVTLILLIVLATAVRTLGFEIAFFAWWFLLVAHGWYLAGGWPQRRQRARSRSRLVLGAAFALPVLVCFGLLRLQVSGINSDVAAAVRAGDCPQAVAALDRRWAFDYVADAPGAVKSTVTGQVCDQLRQASDDFDVAVNGDAGKTAAGLRALQDVLSAQPSHKPMVDRALAGFLGRLPLASGCDTEEILTAIRGYGSQQHGPVLDAARAVIPRLEPGALVACGDTQSTAGDWESARLSYQRALDGYPDSDIRLQAFAGLVKASQAIQLDTVRGLVGTSQGTLPAYCGAPAPYAGAKPYRQSSPNVALLRGSYLDQVPSGWRTDDVARAVLVVCVDDREQGDVVGSCPYRDNLGFSSVVSFHKIAVPIKVIEVRTGKVVAQARPQVSGTSCPQTIYGYGNDQFVTALDTAVSAAVRDALGPIINP